jgi:predicted DNA-binding transcriptional regulator AlpA
MSDTRVTPLPRQCQAGAGDPLPQIAGDGSVATNDTNPAQILTQRGSQRAPRALLPTSTPAPALTTLATREALTVRTSPPTRVAQNTIDLTAIPEARGNGRQQRGANPRHLTIAELCEDLGITRSTFYDWRVKRKAPPCLKLPNGDLRIRRTDYDNWLASLEEEAA